MCARKKPTSAKILYIMMYVSYNLLAYLQLFHKSKYRGKKHKKAISNQAVSASDAPW